VIYALSDHAWDAIDDGMGYLCAVFITGMILAALPHATKLDRDDNEDDE